MGPEACHDDAVLERTFPVAGPLDLRLTLGPLRRGGGDPSCRIGPDGLWRATHTPCGPATVQVRRAGAGSIAVTAWGEGAAWAVETAPALVGALDDAAGFDPNPHPLIADLWRRHQGARFCRTGVLTEALVPTILEQKVVGLDAKASYRGLVRSFGEPAPGPRALGLMLPPTPERLAGLPSWAFHRFNVERKRADTVRVACRVARRLEEAVSLGADTARRRLRALPGIGVWSTAEAMRLAMGDADAVSVGDYHLKHLVSYSLAGEPVGTDERMLELLAPWQAAGQRARVVRLLELGGSMPPRRGPRMPRQSIAAL
jgi:3-methyladenine DNA glycosylase/8-oxoguanine DNA glycosylase